MRRVIIIIYQFNDEFHQRLRAWKWHFLRIKLWWRVNRLKKNGDIDLGERIVIIGEFIRVSRTQAQRMLLESLKEVLEQEQRFSHSLLIKHDRHAILQEATTESILQ